MGFGTLFFGCLLLFNVLYYQITDVIAAAIILYALYRLNRFNKPLRVAYFASYAFFAYSLFELVLGMWALFDPLMGQGEFSGHVTVGRAILLACVMLPTLHLFPYFSRSSAMTHNVRFTTLPWRFSLLRHSLPCLPYGALTPRYVCRVKTSPEKTKPRINKEGPLNAERTLPTSRRR